MFVLDGCGFELCCCVKSVASLVHLLHLVLGEIYLGSCCCTSEERPSQNQEVVASNRALCWALLCNYSYPLFQFPLETLALLTGGLVAPELGQFQVMVLGISNANGFSFVEFNSESVKKLLKCH